MSVLTNLIKNYILCSKCIGTGVHKNEHGELITCDACNGAGYMESSYLNSETIEALQTNLDALIEMTKEDSEYIRKIYEIVSKE